MYSFVPLLHFCPSLMMSQSDESTEQQQPRKRDETWPGLQNQSVIDLMHFLLTFLTWAWRLKNNECCIPWLLFIVKNLVSSIKIVVIIFVGKLVYANNEAKIFFLIIWIQLSQTKKVIQIFFVLFTINTLAVYYFKSNCVSPLLTKILPYRINLLARLMFWAPTTKWLTGAETVHSWCDRDSHQSEPI